MTDVNGTRHHLLLGRDDWQQCTSPTIPPSWIFNDAEQVVTLAPQLFRFPQPPGDPVLLIEHRRGAARDAYGHWYWIGDDTTSIRVRWSHASAGDRYWSAADPVPCEPASTANTGPFAPSSPTAPLAPEVLSGLAVTDAHYLVAGSPEANSLLIFDLHTGGAPSRVALPEVPGTPAGDQAGRFDMAPLPGGGLLLLDRGHKIVWHLDNTFRPVPPQPATPGEPLLFQPIGVREENQRTAPADLTPGPIGLSDAIDPIGVEPLPDGTFLILDREGDSPSIVRRYALTGAPALGSVQLVESNLREPEEPALELDRIVGHDFAVVPEATTGEGGLGTLYVVDAGGNQAFALSLTVENGLALRAQRAYFPLRGHTGKALVAPPGASQVFFDQGERWLPVVTLGRSRYSTSATLDLPVLDGREPDCTWHRLCLDACIPPETAVRVLTRAADERDDLEHQPWRAEPAPYLRGAGAEIPYYRLWGKDELHKPSTGTWELLFQHARGRYLAVRLELSGNGRHAPVIRALRAHYPRFSYLRQYLPGVYQDDRDSAHFLDTFLANPEGLLTTLEGQIAAVETHFDVRTTPSEAVDWLAGWLGLVFDPGWSDYQRRLLLAYAPVFYRRRGTLTGLVQAIRVAVDSRSGPDIFQGEYDDRCSPVRIVERFRTRRMPGVIAGDPTDTETPTGSISSIAQERAHRFVVLLPADVPDEQVRLVKRLVEVEKPAHTQVTIKRFWAMFRVGEARVGLDTRLGEGGRFTPILLGDTALAEGALGDAHPFHLTNRLVLAN